MDPSLWFTSKYTLSSSREFASSVSTFNFCGGMTAEQVHEKNHHENFNHKKTLSNAQMFCNIVFFTLNANLLIQRFFFPIPCYYLQLFVTDVPPP